MNRERKKKLGERRWLERARRLIPTFPKGKVTSGERPDFSIDTGSRRFGIEVTTYNLAPARKQEESFAAVVARAREEYLAKSGAPCHALFDYFPVGPPLRFDELRGRIVRFVSNTFPKMRSDECSFDRQELVEAGLYWSMNRVVLSRVDGMQIFPWIGNAGWVEPSAPVIQSLLDKKERSVAAARFGHEEVWLIIGADGESPARMLDGRQAGRSSYVTSFDRVFLVETHESAWTPNVHELKRAFRVDSF